MNRRELFTSVLKQKNQTGNAGSQNSTLDLSLKKYDGHWSFEESGHLLRRTTFGVTNEQIKYYAKAGLDKTITDLFTKQPLPNPPVNYDCNIDPYVAIGKTWINAPYGTVAELLEYRKRSLFAWIMNILLEEKISIREQLTMFWHNHFSIFDITEHKATYLYSTFLRTEALGNFKNIIKNITISPAMLEFLNGDKNIKTSPNENYARELLELYTVGKGPAAGEGDYTTFTEKDVSEIAKILTGWEIKGRLTTNPSDNNKEVLTSVFNKENHADNSKMLSARFNYATINNQNEKEYAYLIDIILKQKYVAENICRKIYRWFVSTDIDSETEQNIIQPLGALLMKNDYEIQPVVEVLLSSNHFYNNRANLSKIKNPYEFVFGILRQFVFKAPSNLQDNLSFWHQVFDLASGMGMEYYVPPNVAGWKAYYQAPLYDNIWINASTLQKRKIFIDKIISDGFPISGKKYCVDILNLVKSLNNPGEPEECISELAKLFFTKELSPEQYKVAGSILSNGYNNKMWKEKISAYKEESLESGDIGNLESNWKEAIKYLLCLPEYNFL